jgi:signal transduction histidine kinase
MQSIGIATASMQRLVNDILDLAKLQQGRLEINNEPVRCLIVGEPYPHLPRVIITTKADTIFSMSAFSCTQCSITDVLKEVVGCYKHMTHSGVQFGYRCSQDVPPLVLLDATRVKQLLSNGVTNALKLTFSGSVTIQAKMVPVGDQSCLLLEVLDTGRGLNGKDYRKLLDPTCSEGVLLLSHPIPLSN